MKKLNYGKNINLRLVLLKDAKFICELRQNKGKFLSKTSAKISEQKRWIRSYKEREKEGVEYYFIIESKTKEAFGSVRLYDFLDNSFCWGSWIIKDGAPFSAGIESALCVYIYGFECLGFTKSHFDVHKQNTQVVAFHKRFGAKIIKEDELNYYFTLSKEDFLKAKTRFAKYLAGGGGIIDAKNSLLSV